MNLMTLLKPKGEIEYLHKEDTLRQGLEHMATLRCRLSMRMAVMPDR